MGDPSKPSPKPLAELSPEQKLAQALTDQAKWASVAATPGLSPAAATWASQASRSFEAAANLYQKGLQHEQAQAARAAKPQEVQEYTAAKPADATRQIRLSPVKQPANFSGGRSLGALTIPLRIFRALVEILIVVASMGVGMWIIGKIVLAFAGGHIDPD